MSKQVMQQALPLLIAYQDYTNDPRIANKCGEAIKALEVELAKPEQLFKYSDIVSDGELDPRNKFDAQPEHPLEKKADNARELGLDYEPEQEPVAYLYHDASCAELANPLVHSTVLVLACNRKPTYRNETPLYTSPRKEWVGLTDEEMQQVCYEAWTLDPYIVARTIEAKLKVKNYGNV